jgi:hypothetical protein
MHLSFIEYFFEIYLKRRDREWIAKFKTIYFNFENNTYFMVNRYIPGTNEIAFALAGIIVGFFVKLILDYFLSSLIGIFYILIFVLISTILLKRFTIHAYIPFYKLFCLLKMGKKAVKIEEHLGEKDLNILAPAITMSLIIFELFDLIELSMKDYILSLISTIIIIIILFILSFKLAEKIPVH